MSYSKPIIASDIPANREALGDNGYWVQVEDVDSLIHQMNYCCNNHVEIKINGEQNFKRVSDLFTWPKISQIYNNYISNII